MHGRGTPRRLAVRWLAVGIALHLLWAAGPAQAAGDGTGTTGYGRRLPARQDPPPGAAAEDPRAAVQAVEAYARQHLAGTFGGLYLEDAGSPGGGTVVINVTRPPDAEQERALRALLGDRALRLRRVEHSLADLERKQEEITRAMAALGRQGVEIAWVGVDVRTNRVTVAVTGSPAAAEALLRRRVGSEMLEVIQAERVVPVNGGIEPGAGSGPPEAPAQVQVEARQPAPDQAGPAAAPASPRPGIWARFLNALRGWWNALFGGA